MCLGGANLEPGLLDAVGITWDRVHDLGFGASRVHAKRHALVPPSKWKNAANRRANIFASLLKDL